jgi:guanosine-3',5'-bis(diphosphate) 3'-pyrophosphohydrolase
MTFGVTPDSDRGPMTPATTLLDALDFAARKHRDQRRKDAGASPYINHPIAVAHVLATEGGVTELDVLVAAVLHDTVEDTQTTFAELEERFGPTVAALVREVTDDKSLPKDERKRLQVLHAAAASHGAKQIKLSDKICIIRDLTHTPPPNWSTARRLAYLDWAASVVDACRGACPPLEAVFDRDVAKARTTVGGQ